MTRDPKGARRAPAPRAIGKAPFSLRLPEALSEEVDNWVVRNKIPTRAEAIRRLVELGLSADPKRAAGSHKGARKAHAMAGDEIDRASDASASDEQRASRKRRILQGPAEFRDMRRDVAPKKR